MIATVGRALRRLTPGSRKLSPQALQDRKLAKALCNAFERDLEMTGVRGLHFYVQRGHVTIYGTVQHELDRELLVAFVRQIDGVHDATAQLQLAG